MSSPVSARKENKSVILAVALAFVSCGLGGHEAFVGGLEIRGEVVPTSLCRKVSSRGNPNKRSAGSTRGLPVISCVPILFIFLMAVGIENSSLTLNISLEIPLFALVGEAEATLHLRRKFAIGQRSKEIFDGLPGGKDVISGNSFLSNSAFLLFSFATSSLRNSSLGSVSGPI